VRDQEDPWRRDGLRRPSVALEPQLVLSVDVEDWGQSTYDRSRPVTARAERNTHRVLDILAAHRRRATMFVLGLFADAFPAVVRRMAAEGHEIASHGHGHVPIFLQDADAFRQDVRRAKRQLEDLSGQPVAGYRAPDFSIVAKTTWALDVLAEEQYLYDSSIYPIVHGRYGIPEWPAEPAWVTTRDGGSILEMPIATVDFAGRRWPVAGGGYHRAMPWPLIRSAVASVLAEGRVFVSYCHPYEFDPSELKDLGVPAKIRLHQGLGRSGFQGKFERMLATFGGVPAIDVARAAGIRAAA